MGSPFNRKQHIALKDVHKYILEKIPYCLRAARRTLRHLAKPCAQASNAVVTRKFAVRSTTLRACGETLERKKTWA